MSSEVKTIKLNETMTLSFKQNAKGYWYFTEVTVKFNDSDEGMKDIAIEQLTQWRTAMKKAGFIFAEPASTAEIKVEPSIQSEL